MSAPGRAAAADEVAAGPSGLLRQIEFNGAQSPDELGRALAELEPADLAKLCDMLVPPGTGDDTKARMALHALAWYVGGPQGTAEQRARFVNALCQSLSPEKPAEVNEFIIQQLQLVGDARAVPVLAAWLEDGQLHGAAAQALAAIGGERAKAELRAALDPQGRGHSVAVVNALGQLRDEQAAPELRRLAHSDDHLTAEAALFALAAIGEAAPFLDEETIARAAGDDPSRHDRMRLHAAYLEAVSRSGELVTATATIAQLLADDSSAVHNKIASMKVAAESLGPEFVTLLLPRLLEDEGELRAAAIDTAVSLPQPGVTAALARSLEEARAPRADLLQILELRGDATAAAAVLSCLDDADADVRCAAISALAKLSGTAAVPPLVAKLGATDGQTRDAAFAALRRIAAPDAIARIAAELPTASPAVQAGLLDLLAQRRARGAVNDVLSYAENNDEAVRLAAIRALERLGDEAHVPKLLELLLAADEERAWQALEQALAGLCARAADPPTAAAPLIAAVNPDDAGHYAALVRILGHVGGEASLKTVRTALADPRDAVREAAFGSLRHWPDPAAANVVYHFAREANELKYHMLALQAYARLVSIDTQLTPERRLEMYDAGMRITRRPDEQRLLLSRMAEVNHPQALPVVEQYVSDPNLKQEALAAIIRVADGILPRHWAAARQAVQPALGQIEDPALRAQAQRVLERIAEFEDFITDWLVAGPYRQANRHGNELFELPFPPETAGSAEVEWHAQPATDNSDLFWRIDLQRTPAVAGDDRAAYLLTHVFSPQVQAARFEVGSDDGVKIWLNGAVVHANNALRGCERGSDKVAVTLNEGWNELLLKVTNNGGAWGACVRVRSPDGDHLDGVRASANRDE